MTKKIWLLHSIAVLLQVEQEELQERYKQGKNADNGGNDADNCSCFAPSESCSLPPIDLCKPSIVYFQPTFVGYMKIILRLFKEAFLKKKRHDFIVIR